MKHHFTLSDGKYRYLQVNVQIYVHATKLLDDCGFNFNVLLGYPDNTICFCLPSCLQLLQSLRIYISFLHDISACYTSECNTRHSKQIDADLDVHSVLLQLYTIISPPRSVHFSSLTCKTRLERQISSAYLGTNSFSPRLLIETTSKHFQTTSQWYRCLRATFRSDLCLHFKGT